MQKTHLLTPKVLLPLLAGTALLAATSATVIGMASSRNNLTLDNSRVSGNATLFDGSVVAAGEYSRLRLKNGTRMDLSAGSEAKIFANRASLDRGMSEVQSSSGFEIDANTLKIRTADAKAIARVKLDNKSVMVTALNAPVEVLNPAGLLIARVTPGLPLSFMPQAGGGTAFDSTGCVLQKSGAAIIVGTGNQTYELRGADLRKTIGNTAHVTGTIDSSASAMGGASSVVKVTKVTITSKGGCSSVATAVGGSTAAAGLGAAATAGAVAGGAAAGAAAAGVSTTVLVVGGVAAATAASLGGAAAAGSFSSTSP